MRKKGERFYTVRGYALLGQSNRPLTPSMEDYLEMTCRLTTPKGYTRIGDLAEALHVQPSSTTKMVQKLAKQGYLHYERYGLIELTPQGQEIGAYLLHRHEIIEKLLLLLGIKTAILEQTEKIEHNISTETTQKITALVQFLENNQAWSDFKKSKEK